MNKYFTKLTVTMMTCSALAYPAIAQEQDLSFLEVENAGYLETEYDKSFLNDPDAKPVKPETSAFFKGPFVWEIYAKQATPRTVPSSFNNPMTNETASDVGFISSDDTSILLDIFKVNDTAFGIPQNMREVYVEKESPESRFSLFDDPGAIHRVKAKTTLIVQEDQQINMRILSENIALDKQYEKETKCAYKLLINGREIESGEGSQYLAKRPFPKGAYDFEFDLNCNNPYTGVFALGAVAFSFSDDQDRFLPNVSLPYVNRDQMYDGNYQSPVLVSKTLNDRGETIEASADAVNLSRVDMLSNEDQSLGVFEDKHAVTKLFKGDFIPKEAGNYQFLVLTGGNTCATIKPDNFWRWRTFPGISRRALNSFCSDSDEMFYYLTSHPNVMITDKDGTVYAATPQSDVVFADVNGQVYGRSTRPTVGSMMVAEDAVNQPLELHIQMFSNFSENGKERTDRYSKAVNNYTEAEGALLADVTGQWGGVPAGVRNNVKGSKIVQRAGSNYKATHYAGVFVRAPSDKYFRPFLASDFASIRAEDIQIVEKANEISDDWLTGAPEAVVQEEEAQETVEDFGFELQ